MKLLRYGPAKREKPGLLDSKGVIRDLSAHIADGGTPGPTTLRTYSVATGRSLRTWISARR